MKSKNDVYVIIDTPKKDNYETIKLTKGKYTIVDADDFELLNRYNWHFQSRGYACNEKLGLLHRFITNCPKGMVVDHINGDKLDNRKENLRICSQIQNTFNSKGVDNKTSKYKGVSWTKNKNKWKAQIHVNKKNTYLGLFDSEIEAAKKYDEIAYSLYGDFAKLNFKRYATPEEIALLENKPKEFVVGRWYKKVNKQGEVFIFNHQEKGKSYGWFKGDWSTCAWYTDGFVDYVLLTNQEVESALIEEAKSRYKVVFYGFEFDYDKNILFGHYEDSKVVELFNNGKWATIIEQDKFAELKEAHKNGAVIQFKGLCTGEWTDVARNSPSWMQKYEYRIKPEEKLKVSKELKEAFKNGFGVEFRRDSNSEWKRHDNPCWSSKFEWRLMLVNGHPYIRDNYLRDKIDELENRLNKLNNI